VDIVRRERGDAERLIEQFMLQANMGVAETMMSHNLPCLYRIHEEPDPDKIRDFAVFAHNIGLKTHNISNIVKEPAEKSDTDGLSQKSRRLSEKLMLILDEADEKGIADIVSSVLLRCMMKAKYSAECRGHFGLGADLYCHFTSPIRRYPDYFVHSVISTVLAESTSGALTCGCCGFDGIAESAKVALLRKSAGDRAECANDCEVRAVTAERDIEDLYKALFMSNRIGERFEAAVCSVIKFGVFVRMSNLVEGLVPASMFENAVINEELHTLRSKGRTYTLGTVLEVELIEADVSTGRITFKPVL